MELSRLAAPVARLLLERGETIAVSESSSGGLISAALLAVPGASAYFLGGAVVYTGRSRSSLLGLPAGLPAATRSASEPYAALCAATVRGRMNADWGLAETGAAGPAGNRYGDGPGHSCIAVVGPVERVTSVETGRSERESNMWAFARAALTQLEQCIAAAPATSEPS